MIGFSDKIAKALLLSKTITIMQEIKHLLVYYHSITNVLTLKWMELIWFLKKLNSLQRLQEQETLEIILILKLLLIIGLTKIEYIMSIKLILEELKFICWVLLFMLVCLILQGFMLLDLLVGSMVGLDMTEILIWKLIYQNYHLLK